jgi:hypothetical protein
MVDTPAVDLAKAQQAGITTVWRQYSFTIYLMWQPQVQPSYPVPLATTQWGVGDNATLANGTWTVGGSDSVPGRFAATTTYPTWSGGAPIRQSTCSGIALGY